MNAAVHPIILYDGTCGLCNRFNQFMLKRDRHGIFRFAALQSHFAREIVKRHGADSGDLNTVYVVIDCGQSGERLESRARAVLFALQAIGWPWRILNAFSVLPTPVLNLGYRAVARTRYRVFGKHQQCVLPDPEWRERFIAAE